MYEEDLLSNLIDFYEKNKLRIDNILAKEGVLNLKLERVNIILDKLSSMKKWQSSMLNDIECSIKEIKK